MSNIDRTLAFIAAWETCNIDAVVDAVADDLFYHNIPMPAMTGKDALREFAAPLLAVAERIKWEVHHIAESADGAVLTERTDHFHLAGGKTITVRVMGTFEFGADGKLAKWRDYFDLAEFQNQMNAETTS